MTCTTPLLERLDPPDTASECAICHRVTEDGRDLELCDEAVEGLHSAALVRLSARIPTGKQFVCETCLDDLHDAQERHRAEAFDTISDALGLDDCEHPALRAREVVQRLQSSPAPVAGGVPQPETFRREDRYIVLKRSDLERHATPSQLCELERTCEMVRAGRLNEGKRIDHYVVVADDWPEYEETWEKIQARVEGRASRLPAIKPGEVVVSQSYIAALENAANQFCAACIMVGTEDCPRGLHACGKGCSIWRLDAPRINALRAQATTTEKESRR